MRQRFLLIDQTDDVATALTALTAGLEVEIAGTGKVTLLNDIPYGHKFALRDIASGTAVCKYGAEIGLATEDIATGAHVHVHNLIGNRLRGDRDSGDGQ